MKNLTFVLFVLLFLPFTINSQNPHRFGLNLGMSRASLDWAYDSQWVQSLQFTANTDEFQMKAGILFSDRWLNKYQIEGISFGIDYDLFDIRNKVYFILGEDTYLNYYKSFLGGSQTDETWIVMGAGQLFYVGIKPYIYNRLYFQFDAGFNLSVAYYPESILYAGFSAGTVLNIKMGYEF